MNYEQAINCLQDGDIICVLNNRKASLMGKFISYWEKSPIFHTLIVAKVNGAWMALQMDPTGNNLVPFSTFAHYPLHILKKPDYVRLNVPQLVDQVDDIAYSYFSAIESGLKQYLKFLPFIKFSKQKFCSQYCALVWDQGGFMPRIPEDLDPSELEQYLLKYNVHKVEVSCG